MGCEVVGKVVTIPKVGESGTDGRRMIPKTPSVTDRHDRPVRHQCAWLFSSGVSFFRNGWFKEPAQLRPPWDYSGLFPGLKFCLQDEDFRRDRHGILAVSPIESI